MIKQVLVLGVAALTLIGCGDKVTNQQYFVTEEGVRQSFEGVHHFEYGSFIEIMESDSKLQVTDSYFVFKNKISEQFGEAPKIRFSVDKAKVNKTRVCITKNLKFTSGHDLESDDTGSNITGKRKVDVCLKSLGEGKIEFEFQIYQNELNNNINKVIFSRKLKSI